MKAKPSDRCARPINKQRGFVVLVILLALGLSLFGGLIASLSRTALQIERDAQTTASLAQAKAALIGYAVTYYEAHPGQFGFLPCPRRDPAAPSTGEGIAQLSCGLKNVNSLGRLPWRTLGLPPLRDGSGECLWYAVAGSYKNSGTASPDMLNEDSNGLFEIYASDATTKLGGSAPENRPIAVVFAPGTILNGQDRATLATGTEHCGGNYVASNYLDAGGGKNNGVVSAMADTIDKFVIGNILDTGGNIIVNDKLVYITREEIFSAVRKRSDFTQKMADLSFALARCVARFGASNTFLGLPNSGDKGLPWPAPVALTDYRSDTQYNDHSSSSSELSGRLPDVVNNSESATSNMISRVITDCPSSILSAEKLELWRHWKDHFFYAVSAAHKPSSSISTFPCSFSACLKVNGGGGYAAIVMFSGSRLSPQSRNSSPPDPDEKNAISNYLEGRNATNHPNTAGNGNYQKGPESAVFNDVLYCIQTDLTVVSCA